jgi:hypothetical protein
MMNWTRFSHRNYVMLPVAAALLLTAGIAAGEVEVQTQAWSGDEA